MRRLYLLALALFAFPIVAQAQLYQETFETDGNPARYTTSVAEFTDGTSDYFTRTDGSNIGGSNVYNTPEGSFFFAAQDLDGEGGPITVSLTITRSILKVPKETLGRFRKADP